MTKKSPLLKDLLLDYLRQEGLETPLLEYRLVQSWPEVMGTTIEKYTSSVLIQKGVLLVKLKSAALKQNLMMMHTDIAKKLNDHIGSTVISDVRFL